MLSHLALLLLAPWLAILGWVYWSFPRSLPRHAARRVFDTVALLAAAGAAVIAAERGFAAVPPVEVGAFGRPSGAIWQQVLPALLGYGACVAALLLAWVVRSLCWPARAGRSA